MLLWPESWQHEADVATGGVFAPADRSSQRQQCWHGGLGQLSVTGRQGGLQARQPH